VVESSLRRACGGQSTDSVTLSFPPTNSGNSSGISNHGTFGSSSRERATINPSPAAASPPAREWAVQLTPRRDAGGVCVGAIGVCIDVTKVLLARDVTKGGSNSKSIGKDQLVEAANVAIFCVDAGGLITEWNKKAVAITGFPKTDVLGKHLVSNFITEDFRDEMERVIQIALRGESTDNFTFPLFNKNGDRFELLLNTTPYHPVGAGNGHGGDGSNGGQTSGATGVLGIVQVRAPFASPASTFPRNSLPVSVHSRRSACLHDAAPRARLASAVY
jgi:PAS domain S-box-containing protein